MKLFKLSETELDVMLALWKCEEPIRPATLLEKMSSDHDWSISTLQTLLDRLHKKQMVHMTCQKRFRYYFPAVTKEEYAAGETGSLINYLEDYSPVNLMAGLIQNVAMTDDEIGELEKLLQEAKNKKK